MNNTFEQTEILRVKYRNSYDSARKNSLYAVILTFVSIILLATVGISFYFSAYLPVTLMESGVYARDMDKAEFTDKELIEAGIPEADIPAYREELAAYQAETDGTTEFIVCAGLSVMIAAFYLVCWLMSKKHPAWMIVLTVTYILDTLIMIPDLLSYYLTTDIRGFLFLTLYHAWILYLLISGMIAGMKLKKLPAPIAGVAVEVDPTVEAAPAEVAAPAEAAVPAEVAPVDTDNTPEA